MQLKTKLRALLVGLTLILLIAGPIFSPDVPAATGQRKVLLYFSHDGESSNRHSNPFNLQAVTRKVSAAAPMRPTLDALLAGPTPAEESSGFHGLNSQGLDITRLELKGGTAYASFKHRRGAEWAGEMGPPTFRDGVKRTLRQFPSVRRVVVCVDGYLDFDNEGDNGPQKKCH